jgi:hypothetical protein
MPFSVLSLVAKHLSNKIPPLAYSQNLGATFGSPFKHEITSAPQHSNMMITILSLKEVKTFSKVSTFD